MLFFVFMTILPAHCLGLRAFTAEDGKKKIARGKMFQYILSNQKSSLRLSLSIFNKVIIIIMKVKHLHYFVSNAW